MALDPPEVMLLNQCGDADRIVTTTASRARGLGIGPAAFFHRDL
ncbi:hypothetical protein ACIRP7_13780 [Streptomyces sp. NPDC102270]